MALEIKPSHLHEPGITAFGGGTGLSSLLRGLKTYTENITAVVTVADDGGGSGRIRQDFGILPPGDIRNCILALANAEPVMEQLLRYRYKEGTLRGQNFGNLLIAALTDLAGGFEKAVKQLSQVLAVTGQVLPVSLESLHLYAYLQDGTLIQGESSIPRVQMERCCPIQSVFISPPDAAPMPEVIAAIEQADILVYGPGSLYTSILPHFLLSQVREALRRAQAPRVYIDNIMTQPGETQGYGLADHLKALLDHGGAGCVDFCIANTQIPPEMYLERYRADGSEPVLAGLEKELLGIQVFAGDFLHTAGDYLRHNPNALAEAVLGLIPHKGG
jgi:uncharacterized cofD-like protein